MNMNPGETAVHQAGPNTFLFAALGIKSEGDPAYRTLQRTGEVNGIRVLAIDLGDGKGFQDFANSKQSEAEAARAAQLEAEAEAARAAEEEAKAKEKAAAKAEAEAKKAEALAAAKAEADAKKAGKSADET
jgi:hypothetical protein